MGELGVTIAGVPLDHRLYHFRLAYAIKLFPGFVKSAWALASIAAIVPICTLD